MYEHYIVQKVPNLQLVPVASLAKSYVLIGAMYLTQGPHRVDWEAATVKQVEMNYTRWKIIEAIHIKKQKVTSNQDCGRSLNPVWQPLLCPP